MSDFIFADLPEISRSINKSSSSNEISVYLTNGTYPYSVTAIPNYSSTKTSGYITVNGSSLTDSINFSRAGAIPFSSLLKEEALSLTFTAALVFLTVMITRKRQRR
ncbi:hypothetical protein IX51_02765 [uncultured archaeon]|nr:hypothetical protein IX51_02765 [uncultured archaeon]